MKTVHTRYITLSVVICILVSLMTITANAAVSSEDGYGSSEYIYRGPYDIGKNHEVNLYHEDPTKVDELQQIMYKEFLTWGMTPQGASAVLGNIACESGYDPTRTQSNVSWEDFSWGTTGLGLIQWTYWSLQADLFNTASKMGRLWSDLSVQFEAMKHIFGPGNGIDYLYTDGAGTAYNLAGRFMDDVEKPAVRNYALRGRSATDAFNKLSGLEPEEYGGDYDSEQSGDTDLSTESGLNSYRIVNEWELAGMPASSGISKELTSVRMPTTMANYKENNSLHQIGSDITLRNEFNAWETARVIIVFVGMLLVVYGLFLAMSMIMDNVNSFIDISFVSLMSFGALYYTRDMDTLTNPRRFISGKRLIIVIIIIIVIGLMCISGGVFSSVLKTVYKISEIFGG